jgi:hypothetical protein
VAPMSSKPISRSNKASIRGRWLDSMSWPFLPLRFEFLILGRCASFWTCQIVCLLYYLAT